MSDVQLPNIDYTALLPLLIVLGAACIGILAEGFLPRAHRFKVQVPLTLLALVAAIIAIFPNIGKSAPVFTTNDGTRVDAVITDGPGLFLTGTIAVLGIIAVLLIAERRVAAGGAFVAHAAVAADSKADADQSGEPGATEVFPLTLFSIGGMMLFCTAGDLLTMFVALEVFSLPLYLLCGLARRRRLLSQESAMKYFLLGAFASAFFVYGIALLYGFAGSVELADINTAVLESDNSEVLLLGGLAMLSVGLLFKAAAVPFHVWTPDVYTGAPTPITALMAACTKVAAFGGMLRVFNVAFGNAGDPGRTSLQWEWQPLLTAIAIATMVVGAILAVTQTDIKRLLAYSSIANAGYILVGVIALHQAVAATMFYLAAYGFTVLAAFAIVTLVRDSQGEATHLSRWAGLAKSSPRFAVIFTLLMLAFAGIPLTSGFAAKFELFSSALSAGQTGLVIVGVLSSVILAFPYLKVVVLLWLNEPVEDAPTVSLPSFATGTAVAIGVAATVLLGVAPQMLLDLVNNAGTFLAK
ncbi:MAG TPA: NADH-quinone oxidoreductase subunit NuoN [Stackebrandtia sp.]|uniref:NADH-quinone oxidoreductase subunit NuoN n=1 Tax=Stackebrandtia sp. TaxID=2023065 RepID=UPI002D3AC19A|nr:NADH-quinone oxidoreductase subunit NuoN [Stackebrandtia sp.]HZE40734.1 NADH-quinone oxidoreductase subunit NuoN [Stackebrandtia sp.]